MISRPSLLFALLVLGVCGCPGAPEPAPEVPPQAAQDLGVDLYYTLGHPLRGAAQVSSQTPTEVEPLAVRVVVEALAEFRETLLEPMSTRVRLVSTLQGPEPLRPSPELFAGARAAWFPVPATLESWFAAGRGGATERLASFDGVLFPDTSAVFEVRKGRGRDVASVGSAVLASELNGELRTWVHRRPPSSEGETIDVVLVVERADGVGVREAGRLAHEMVLLDPQLLAGSQGGFVAIVPRPSPHGGALAILIEIMPFPTDGPSRVAFEAARREWSARLVEVEPDPEPVPPPALVDGEAFVEGVAEAGSLTQLRRRLVGVAARHRARLACELALGSDEELVRALAARVQALDPATLKVSPGRAIERIAVELAAEGLARGGDRGAAILGKLVGYAGTSTDPAELLACLDGASDLSAHERALVAANRKRLDDPAPLVRRRARAWLVAHGEAGE